ncbi:MAG: hypothetical protein J7513_18040 [Solirubrobacteraceae bacterium]|nr:hypothetical protein [Solirubrobacteraceae bacterium]
MQRALEWFGLRDSPADDDGLGTYLLGSLGLMLIITTGDESSAARDAWFWIYGIALLALLVGPEQEWLTTQDFLAAIDENLQAAMA